jgi:hypothetical protein
MYIDTMHKMQVRRTKMIRIRKMKFQKAIGSMIFFVIMFFIAYSTAYAVPIDPLNGRPVSVTIPSGDGSGTDLQTILDTVFPGAGLDASTDQNTTGMWAYASGLPGGTIPILKFEYAGLAASNIFGIWSDPDMDTATAPITVDIFLGGASPPTFATLTWNDPYTLIVSDPLSTGNVNTGTYTGINPYSFGFYLKNSEGIFYTVDQLNNAGEAMALAYEKYPGANIWAIAFEDIAGGDKDYNDMVVQVESIKPVPEPGTLALLGSGLICIGIYRWRKMKK